MRRLSLVAAAALTTACTISPDRPQPHTDYPDFSTPPGFSEYNGGILDNTLVVGSHKYDTVTPNLAARVEKWQGNRNGFIPDPRPQFAGCTAIDKAVMFQFDFR